MHDAVDHSAGMAVSCAGDVWWCTHPKQDLFCPLSKIIFRLATHFRPFLSIHAQHFNPKKKHSIMYDSVTIVLSLFALIIPSPLRTLGPMDGCMMVDLEMSPRFCSNLFSIYKFGTVPAESVGRIFDSKNSSIFFTLVLGKMV